ncbi:hypothetical protein FFLO_02643 [Filobasidium floriforme]|uniref:Uncharacterized protein n=1 Tax=Filobasidium floriforme TaxID=5210 RepID=A0A8K0JM92_9TREE|nr:uncharacterized protein HD553DRAFT_338710 [Filobasidium floriforme]KAG7561914.1 hypothetical protein FFLO_02643 [Filobasidium floriforme]KAH8089395.1 hypothetical protein HD553DRAFT_338710 [Filobasidium floriforme]
MDVLSADQTDNLSRQSRTLMSIFPPVSFSTGTGRFVLDPSATDASSESLGAEITSLIKAGVFEPYLDVMNSTAEYSRSEDEGSLVSRDASVEIHQGNLTDKKGRFNASKLCRDTKRNMNQTINIAKVYEAYIQGRRLDEEKRISSKTLLRDIEVDFAVLELESGGELHLEFKVKERLAELTLEMIYDGCWTMEMYRAFHYLYQFGKRGQKAKDDVEFLEEIAEEEVKPLDYRSSDDDNKNVEMLAPEPTFLPPQSAGHIEDK